MRFSSATVQDNARTYLKRLYALGERPVIHPPLCKQANPPPCELDMLDIKQCGAWDAMRNGDYDDTVAEEDIETKTELKCEASPGPSPRSITPCAEKANAINDSLDKISHELRIESEVELQTELQEEAKPPVEQNHSSDIDAFPLPPTEDKRPDTIPLSSLLQHASPKDPNWLAASHTFHDIASITQAELFNQGTRAFLEHCEIPSFPQFQQTATIPSGSDPAAALTIQLCDLYASAASLALTIAATEATHSSQMSFLETCSDKNAECAETEMKRQKTWTAEEAHLFSDSQQRLRTEHVPTIAAGAEGMARAVLKIIQTEERSEEVEDVVVRMIPARQQASTTESIDKRQSQQQNTLTSANATAEQSKPGQSAVEIEVGEAREIVAKDKTRLAKCRMNVVGVLRCLERMDANHRIDHEINKPKEVVEEGTGSTAAEHTQKLELSVLRCLRKLAEELRVLGRWKEEKDLAEKRRSIEAAAAEKRRSLQQQQAEKRKSTGSTQSSRSLPGTLTPPSAAAVKRGSLDRAEKRTIEKALRQRTIETAEKSKSVEKGIYLDV